jgi:hypothetical protein
MQAAEGDAVAADDDTAVVDGVVREENRPSIWGWPRNRPDADLDDFLQVDRLLDGEKTADAASARRPAD